MKIIIAPDSFKECLTSEEAANYIIKGIRKHCDANELVSIPLADGGEGIANVLVKAKGGRMINVNVHDPLMRKHIAGFGILGDKKTAVIETAAASGLALLGKEERNPMKTTTYGTGELIKAALDKGCNRIIIGLGGSATNDGGAGLLEALGARFLDNNNQEIPKGGEGLEKITSLDISGLDTRISQCKILAACDVKNPLCGSEGASFIFGPQKGATSQMCAQLDRNLKRFAEIIERDMNISVEKIPGAGAAGGMGAGLMAFLNAEPVPGFELVADMVGLEKYIMEADLLITAEGKVDAQTLSGKVPAGVARLGKKHGIPVIIFCGVQGEGAEKLFEEGATAIISISGKELNLKESIAKAGTLLETAAENAIKTWKNK